MTTVDRPTTQGWVADDSTFGARLALIRQHMKWGNVKEAAVACGLPTESWRSWERDGRVPQRLVEISTIIAQRTGCDRTWLVMGRDGNGAKEHLPEVNRSADPGRVSAPYTRHTAGASSPMSPQRRDSTRPQSAVPATKRRPTTVRSPSRPMAA